MTRNQMALMALFDTAMNAFELAHAIDCRVDAARRCVHDLCDMGFVRQVQRTQPKVFALTTLGRVQAAGMHIELDRGILTRGSVAEAIRTQPNSVFALGAVGGGQ